jgi:Bromodomain
MHFVMKLQKKSRYKKMIRRHVDLQIVSSKLSKGLISSPKELLRDLLLLANNALVFFPKNSPEHNSAIILRKLSRRALKMILSSSPNSSLSEEVEPEKPRFKEDSGIVEENKELDKEVPSKNKELDKEVPSKNKELDKEVRSKNKELDKEVPSKNKELDGHSKNKELDKEVRSKSKELDKVVPSKNKESDREVLRKNKLENVVPIKNKELDKEAPKKKKELYKEVPSRNKELGKEITNKIRELDKKVLSKPPNNTRSGKLIKKITVDKPARGGNQRGAPSRGRKRARR